MDKALMSTGKDDWETPQWLYEELNQEFHFTLDACANESNFKNKNYFSEADDGLKSSWSGETVFCNPPYSKRKKGKPGQEAWIKKACVESQTNGATVVMLIPARTDTKAFHKYIMGKAREIRFIKGRVKFEFGGEGCLPHHFPV